jgi:hypothetical protein
VRKTKKGKPYVICNPCGLQMFVRVESGIQRFERLVADAALLGLEGRLVELQMLPFYFCPGSGFAREVMHKTDCELVLDSMSIRLPGYKVAQHPGFTILAGFYPQASTLKSRQRGICFTQVTPTDCGFVFAFASG